MHFQRFTADDPIALERNIASAQAQLIAVRAAGDEAKALDVVESLGGMLTTARREGEARALLVPAVSAARELGPSELLGWLLLQLATANHYLDLRHEAHQQFEEALAIAETLRLERLTHFTLSHWARCLVEDGEFDRAKAFFTRALDMRVRLGDPRQAASRKALDALEALASPKRRADL